MDGAATEARPAYGDVDPEAPGDDREGDRGGNGNGVDVAPWSTTLDGRWLVAAEIGVAVVVAIGLVLRFWTRSALWLDEALTVDIARLPVHEIPSYLKRDGAPPLYYVLLHFWMKPFGDSDVAVRSLSGVFSVATLPVVWIVGRRLGGRSVAWVLLVAVASAPFAIYYATEARMYSLVMFLTACGLWALSRVLEKARPGNVVALAVVTAALLYTQYWALYLVGSIGLWLLWQLWRGRPEWRSNARWALGAIVVGCLAFIPWVPTFLYQSRYTGTPWAGTPTYAAIINAITGFTDNQASNAVTGSNQGRLLALGYFALAGLGLFGVARGRWHIDLDIRTRPQGRGLAFAVVVTLAAAITGGILSQSAFSARYAAVVFIPLLALLALGTLTFADARLRLVVVAVVAVAGVASSIPNITTQRTQAPAVAATLAAHARPGDIVAYCPDQLGPAVYRLTGSNEFDQTTFPRGSSPAYVDWVHYKNVAEAAQPGPFAKQLEAMAGDDHDIWLVSAPGYQGFSDKCQILAADLLQAPGYGGHQWVNSNPQRYYEPMGLTQFAPSGAS